MSDSRSEPLTVYADYVCPFCYLGRRSLERYQETREEPVEIDWHPFDLRSGKRDSKGEIDHEISDSEGRDPSGNGTQSGDEKDDEYFEHARENVRRLQREYDVEMAQEIAREVDSLPAQAASLYVKERQPERWREFDEAIYDALWQEGQDIGDRDVLADVVKGVSLDPKEILGASEDEGLRARLAEEFSAARERGVTGVPTFVYDDYAARGAVPPKHLDRLIGGR